MIAKYPNQSAMEATMETPIPPIMNFAFSHPHLGLDMPFEDAAAEQNCEG